MKTALSPDHLLNAYAMGIFPMAEGRDDPEIHWVDPRRRGILPLDGFHISRSLRRRILTAPWRVTADTAFGPDCGARTGDSARRSAGIGGAGREGSDHE